MNFFSAPDTGVKSDFAGSSPSDQLGLTSRQLLRLERDRERGYSINAKQIILAFAVEFVIIGLILTNNAMTVLQLPDVAYPKVIQALLFPIAMAMVELARVPLAVAVRTQPSWNIKFAALIGVCCAVAVTSVSLYLIGHSTFSPRLEETNTSDNKVAELNDQRRLIAAEAQRAIDLVSQKQKERDSVYNAHQNLVGQLNAQPPQNCGPVTVPSPAPNIPSSTQMRCVTNPVLRTLNSEIAAAKSRLNEAEAALKAAETERALPKYDTSAIDKQINEAEIKNRLAIDRSQLHAYAAMLFQKDPKDVTDADVKTLEFYLILIPSIAAALSSTLIAMTAVRRIKPVETSTVTIPDEAVTYLFGPLVAAIRAETQAAVDKAVKSNPS